MKFKFLAVLTVLVVVCGVLPAFADCSSVIIDGYGKRYTATAYGGSEANYEAAYTKAIQACEADAGVFQSKAKCMYGYVKTVGFSGDSCAVPKRYSPEPVG